MKPSAVAALIAAGLLAGCGGQGHPARSRPRAQTPSATQAPTATPAGPARTHTRPTRTRAHRTGPHRHRPRPDPGRLPQTKRLPSASSPRFLREMDDLWHAVTSGRLKPGLPAFFPEAAYAQVKAIADPGADWRSRLVGAYAADIAAAHHLLGAGASRARLRSVRVPAGYPHWIPPGTCENRVGYWETPNSRLVYSERGRERSFGIASLISWRGVWYVVHLGAILRSGPGGRVDDPSPGAGYAAPSSTC